MTLPSLVLRYVAFALIATLANLATQRLILATGRTAGHFVLAVACGTCAGLVLKYLLDKRWIFQDRARGLGDHRRKFTLYTGMGLVSTAIFWGGETLFWLIWHSDRMRETGAVLGLMIGYVVKYQLDRRFVFGAPQGKAAR